MDDNIAKTIGTRIRLKREAIEISQKALAERDGISPAAINQFEKGEKKPSSSVLAIISRELGVSTDYLLGASDLSDNVVAAFRDFDKLGNEDKKAILGHIEYLKAKSRRKKTP